MCIGWRSVFWMQRSMGFSIQCVCVCLLFFHFVQYFNCKNVVLNVVFVHETISFYSFILIDWHSKRIFFLGYLFVHSFVFFVPFLFSLSSNTFSLCLSYLKCEWIWRGWKNRSHWQQHKNTQYTTITHLDVEIHWMYVWYVFFFDHNQFDSNNHEEKREREIIIVYVRTILVDCCCFYRIFFFFFGKWTILIKMYKYVYNFWVIYVSI